MLSFMMLVICVLLLNADRLCAIPFCRQPYARATIDSDPGIVSYSKCDFHNGTPEPRNSRALELQEFNKTRSSFETETDRFE